MLIMLLKGDATNKQENILSRFHGTYTCSQIYF